MHNVFLALSLSPFLSLLFMKVNDTFKENDYHFSLLNTLAKSLPGLLSSEYSPQYLPSYIIFVYCIRAIPKPIGQAASNQLHG